MTDNERAVIEAAVEWGRMREMFGPTSQPAIDLANALNELHNEHDGRWEPSHD